MREVLLTAFGVGGATLLGSLLGFVIKKPSQKLNDGILSFAAGIMLAAAIVGLIIPSLEYNENLGVLFAVIGIILGALFLNFVDKLVPHLHKLSGQDIETHQNNKRIDKIILFVIAIAIHNLPEGIAAGVSFGDGNVGHALSVSLGIALQNVPEGMIIIAPMLSAGISKKRTLFIATMTGVVEIIGTLIGYFFVSISTAILPFALSFAGGTMLYVISDEMIPETHSHGNERLATYALLLGFCVMLVLDFFLA